MEILFDSFDLLIMQNIKLSVTSREINSNIRLAIQYKLKVVDIIMLPLGKKICFNIFRPVITGISFRLLFKFQLKIFKIGLNTCLG